jgi:hypothetical protein
MNIFCEENNDTEVAYYKRKDSWFGRRKMGIYPRFGKIFDMKMRIERNGIELI